MFIIKDWAGNIIDFGTFETFDDAEEFLCGYLDTAYDTDRDEYVVVPAKD